ncbi:uncharacterized protein LOC127841576 [Dreissena polymorpha]|uniref:Uncharacterized protein n=1 Tax=Dreissena polymorpha TaxID=45954 RepID=A0A9D4EG79_DREPO|nr:uncharacterized protein LOC127841576 [Dreissena polymorpha]KAH3779757.1 hypothetical protein DPMN_157563 [Dreissena polymorpha]
MPLHNGKLKCDRAEMIALFICAIDYLLQHADESKIKYLSSVLADMSRKVRDTQDQNDRDALRKYCKDTIRQLCSIFDHANTGYLEKQINCIEGLTPISQQQEEVLKQRVESWRQILLCTAESNLERDIHARLVQIRSIRGYFSSALCGRRNETRCVTDIPQTFHNTY